MRVSFVPYRYTNKFGVVTYAVWHSLNSTYGWMLEFHNGAFSLRNLSNKEVYPVTILNESYVEAVKAVPLIACDEVIPKSIVRGITAIVVNKSKAELAAIERYPNMYTFNDLVLDK
jgi:hypothetical protein